MILQRKAVFLIFAAILCAFFPLYASADLGPKPKLTVTVDNPPEGEYYLDLLVDYDLPLCDNLKDRRDLYDEQKLKLLAGYNEFGWYAALAHGTSKTVWGDLTGISEGGSMAHSFGCYGLPDRYKLIIITPENRIIVTRTVERTAYTSAVRYDYATGILTEQSGVSMTLTYIKQYLMTLTCALIAKCFMLAVFRFRRSGTLKTVFVTNLLTQAALTAIMAASMLKLGIYASYAVLGAALLLTAGVETIVCCVFFAEKSRGKRIAYSVTANLLSSLLLLPVIYLEYLLFIT